MKYFMFVLGTVYFIATLCACDSKPKEPQGDPFLLNAAKNSQQAKQAEDAINDAAAKAKANTDAALKQIEEVTDEK